MMRLCNTYRLIVSCTVVLVVLSAFCELGFCGDEVLIRMKPVAGGVRDSVGMQNSVEIESMGRFAVDEHNKKEELLCSASIPAICCCSSDGFCQRLNQFFYRIIEGREKDERE
ncbi:hypothetical protein Vadar_017845 [Vaccinium darrowii]|uniref:Uncharacterized protein n=1 Tax=Vaccinium darrowii TaxID=229202 RepID=A0ACB7XRJ0_9ERIC|nr:hypothetical protein Vadar_017845 [Vaccinium darrowii]